MEQIHGRCILAAWLHFRNVAGRRGRRCCGAPSADSGAAHKPEAKAPSREKFGFGRKQKEAEKFKRRHSSDLGPCGSQDQRVLPPPTPRNCCPDSPRVTRALCDILQPSKRVLKLWKGLSLKAFWRLQIAGGRLGDGTMWFAQLLGRPKKVPEGTWLWWTSAPSPQAHHLGACGPPDPAPRIPWCRKQLQEGRHTTPPHRVIDHVFSGPAKDLPALEAVEVLAAVSLKGTPGGAAPPSKDSRASLSTTSGFHRQLVERPHQISLTFGPIHGPCERYHLFRRTGFFSCRKGKKNT